MKTNMAPISSVRFCSVFIPTDKQHGHEIRYKGEAFAPPCSGWNFPARGSVLVHAATVAVMLPARQRCVASLSRSRRRQGDTFYLGATRLESPSWREASSTPVFRSLGRCL
jgi:hypothetical protein